MLKLYGHWYGLCAACPAAVAAHSQPQALTELCAHTKEDCPLLPR